MDFHDFKIIIAGGPTREWMDPVRFLTNPSSGKMAFYLARILEEQCRELVYITGPVADAYRNVDGAKNISVDTTRDMLEAVQKEVCSNTVLIMAAAPMDFYFKFPSPGKIKKDANAAMMLELSPNPDILISMAQKRIENNLSRFYLVGFAAETENMKLNGLKKLREKNLEMIFVNEVYRDEKGFGAENNKYLAIRRDGKEETLGPATKENLALEIARFVKDNIEPSPGENIMLQ